jgi:hypothetical protein
MAPRVERTVALEFETFWNERFGETPPLGYYLRESFRPRWVRIHSLPEGKRYADDDGERGEVLARANAAGTAVLGEGSRCWVVVPEYELESNNSVPELGGVELRPAITVRDPDGSDAEEITFWAAEVDWHSGRFDEMLRAIADDRRWALWVTQESADVFAPYDGGADLIASSDARSSSLREEMRPWLSQRGDGL